MLLPPNGSSQMKDWVILFSSGCTYLFSYLSGKSPKLSRRLCFSSLSSIQKEAEIMTLPTVSVEQCIQHYDSFHVRHVSSLLKDFL